MKHSRLNEPPLQVWIINQEDGSVDTPHCTCMAGISEVCSHVGTILYALEHIYSSRESTSCTDIQSLWNVPNTSGVEPQALKDLMYGRVISSSSDDIRAMTVDKIKRVLNAIQNVGSSACLTRVIEPFASNMCTEEKLLPNPYKNLYKLFIERVVFNEGFWYNVYDKTKDFQKNFVLSELIGTHFTPANTNLNT